MKRLAALIVSALVVACSAPSPKQSDVVAEALRASVVLEIKVTDATTGVQSDKAFCSGTAIAPGVILTNRHCVVAVDGQQIYVRFYNGDFVKAELLAVASDGETSMPSWGDERARATDAALLSVDPRFTTHIARVNVNHPTVSDNVFAIGSPKGLRFTVTFGHVAFVARDLEDVVYGPNTWLQHDAPVNPGNSGGGLFNEAGELIGVNTLTGGDNLSLSVPIGHILDLFQSYL